MKHNNQKSNPNPKSAPKQTPTNQIQIQVNPTIQTLSNPKQLKKIQLFFSQHQTLGTSKGSSVFGNNVIASQ